MTADAARDLVLRALADVAPEADLDHLPGDRRLQEELDLDSMDFLTVLEAVAEGAGVDIPDRDAARLATLDGAVDYLVAATA